MRFQATKFSSRLLSKLGCVRRALSFFLVLGVGSVALAQTTPQVVPVLFVHGINSAGNTWANMIGTLDRGGSLTGGRLRVTSDTANVTPSPLSRCDWAGSWGEVSLLRVSDPSWPVTASMWNPLVRVGVKETRRYFAIDFSSPINLSLKEQAREIKIVINCIKSIVNPISPDTVKVVLVAHSMGGLASRAYLQGMGAAGYKYEGDVLKLITIGTPHLGVPMGVQIASYAGGYIPTGQKGHPLCEAIGDYGGLCRSSEAVRLLTDTAVLGEINQLNLKIDKGDPASPERPPPAVIYFSISVASPLGADDGLVPVRSQLGFHDKLETIGSPQYASVPKSFVMPSTRFAKCRNIVHACETADPEVIHYVAGAIELSVNFVVTTYEHSVSSSGVISVGGSLLAQ